MSRDGFGRPREAPRSAGERRESGPGELSAPIERRVTAEIAGTFALVFVAAGADTLGRLSGGAIGPAERAVAPGLLVAALIYAISDASGAHFNPIVTLAFTLKRTFPVRRVPEYWISQLVGGLAAALLLRLLFGSAAEAGVSATRLDPVVTATLEAVLTWLLVTVILGTADRARVVGSNAAIAVGSTIALCGLMALPVEGASMNPARSLAPAFVNGALGGLWPFVVGPALGALCAVLLTRLLHGSPEDEQAVKAAQGNG